jgi:hypothetical protein
LQTDNKEIDRHEERDERLERQKHREEGDNRHERERE